MRTETCSGISAARCSWPGRPESNRAAFSFIKYKPAVAGAGVKGGGFAMFETTLALPKARRTASSGRVLTEPGVTSPRLAPVIFETGSVQCMALNLQGSGGAVAVDPPPGAFNAVQHILGATTPAMDADNRAAFSLTLSQEGAIILEQAFEDGWRRSVCSTPSATAACGRRWRWRSPPTSR